MNRFDQKLAEHCLTLRRGQLHTLQLNIGRKCNQACRHCHVDAAPWRTEMIDADSAEHEPGLAALAAAAVTGLALAGDASRRVDRKRDRIGHSVDKVAFRRRCQATGRKAGGSNQKWSRSKYLRYRW